MSIPTIKISQTNNIGRDMDPTDLFYISAVDPLSPTGYTSYNIEAKQLSNGVEVGKIFSQTQWSKKLSSPVALSNGSIANGMVFFDNATDKVLEGTTTYDEYDIVHGIEMHITGSSGVCEINIAGVNYTMTFNTDIITTIKNWLTLHEATLKALGIIVGSNGSSPLNPLAISTIRVSATQAICNGITFTTTSGTLSGTLSNFFTGTASSAGDHILIPYAGTAYDGLRLTHTFRVNFDISTGSVQTLQLSLRRYIDDTIIGSLMKVVRDPDVAGNQFVFETYTSGSDDPFVNGGFYFLLENYSGSNVSIENNVGILTINHYQNPINI